MVRGASSGIAEIAEKRGYRVPYSSRTRISDRLKTGVWKGVVDVRYSVWGPIPFSYQKTTSLQDDVASRPWFVRISLSRKHIRWEKETLTQICYSLNFTRSVSISRFQVIVRQGLVGWICGGDLQAQGASVARVDKEEFRLEDNNKKDWLLYFPYFFGPDHISARTLENVAIPSNRR